MNPYVIGLVAADGHVDNYRWQISQGEAGLDILLKIQSQIVDGYINKANRSAGYSNVPVYIFFCKYSSEIFSEWGIPKGNKTYSLIFPENKKEKDIWVYLRGFFDGDGSIHVDGKYPRVQLISNDNWCLGCLRFFNSQGIVSYYHPDKRHPHIGSVVIRRVNSVHEFMSRIYSGDLSLFLDRKFYRWKEIEKSYPRLQHERPVKKFITEDMKTQIRSMVLKGFTIHEIASTLGISNSPVQRIFASETGGRKRKREEQEGTVRKLLDEGYSSSFIRKSTKIHNRVISHIIKERSLL